MNRLRCLLGIAVMLHGQNALAKSRLTDPIKVARECKSEVERLCKGVRPGGQRMVNCLMKNTAELSTACSVALKSAEPF